MDRKPLKRHPVLIPLSRQHHKGLLLAQLLKSDAPDYKGMPVDIPGKVAFAKKEYGDRLRHHFEWEAGVLIPATQAYHEQLQAMADQVQSEHQQIAEQVGLLSSSSSTEDLDRLGRLIEQHIRFEERVWFTAIQKMVPETVLSQLPPL
ncbi:MAG: hemerythrin domain-containing protein [Phaeodactylibacter sp.]|uniref:hemerythrin domain-containing protein n=1 Tax=Phaeodactylibacter sp. TaxID=1940289 RepID=UPI0032EADC76